MDKLKDQLPGLTGLRFFAALLVISCHLQQFMAWANISASSFMVRDGVTYRFPDYNPLFDQLAGDGVFFFFILSGFLITYLLFREQRSFGDISIKRFYARRILRIWPLYFTIVYIGLVMCPTFDITLPGKFYDGWDNFWPRLGLFVIMLPQLGTKLYPEVASTGHLWSIGVEEAFYLIWPPVLKLLKKSSIIFAVFILVGTFLAQNIPAINSLSIRGIEVFKLGDQYLRIFCFQYIALGAIGAWIAVHKPNWCKLLFRHEVQAIVYFFVIKHLVYYSDYGRWDALGRGIPNVLLVMNVGLNPKTWFSFENKILKYLGGISFGIYMYHIICIHLMVLLLQRMGLFNSLFSNSLFLYATSIPLTVACAAVSNRYLERRFLNMRAGFKPEKVAVLST